MMYFAKQMNLATFATTVLTANTKNFYHDEKDYKIYIFTDGLAIDFVRMQSGGRCVRNIRERHMESKQLLQRLQLERSGIQAWKSDVHNRE